VPPKAEDGIGGSSKSYHAIDLLIPYDDDFIASCHTAGNYFVPQFWGTRPCCPLACSSKTTRRRNCDIDRARPSD
jgi:hypothetical protein